LGAGGAHGIMLYNPHVNWYAAEARASMRYGLSVPGGGWWDVGARAHNAVSFAYSGIAGHRLWLAADGHLGICTNDPQGRLDVRMGGGGWERLVVTTTANWGDGAAQHVTIGAGGAAGIMFANPHVSWHPTEPRASIRYGRTNREAGNTFWDVGLRND